MKKKNNYLYLIMIICLIVFLGLLEDVFEKEIMTTDVIGYNFISTYLISPVVTPIAKFITNFGDIPILIVLTIILIIFIKNKFYKITIILNLGLITLLNQLLKFIVQRPRPTEYRFIDASGYSFPSGHSMVSMAFYGYLIYLTYKHVKNKYLKWTQITFLSLLIVCIGLSRIYLGVHYTSDVIAGFAISIIYLIVFIKLSEKRKKNEKEK